VQEALAFRALLQGHQDPVGYPTEDTAQARMEPRREQAISTHTSRPPNPTAPNEQTRYLSGDFTDTDGDGMTDAAEIKYGFDPMDPGSFPEEPEIVPSSNIPIPDSGISAEYEGWYRCIVIRWENPTPSSYSLSLYNGARQLYYGGHYSEHAPVSFSEFGLEGTEVLTGHFSEYDGDGAFVCDFPEFSIDLSQVPLPVVGDLHNRISYTFSEFTPEAEQVYREYLKRLFPLLVHHLGPPSENFNCVITYMGSGYGYFMIVDSGRTFLSTMEFIPRLIAHEFVHAWKGQFTFASDENWVYDPTLTGFEEATAEGMAFELMHEYVRSYPDHPASIQLLDWRPYQYWSSKTTHDDSVKHLRSIIGGFWDPPSLVYHKYSVAASTWQIMTKENPNAYKEVMERYYNRINSDSEWRSNREDLLELWAEVVPRINGVDTKQYLNAIPVFQEARYDEGIYVFSVIRPYGSIGDQQFASTYANRDGNAWWGILESAFDEYAIPAWVPWILVQPYFYIHTQNQPFTVDVYNGSQELVAHRDETSETLPEGDLGYGWKMVDELDMADYPVGLYKETVAFQNFLPHDPGAGEDFYFFGLQGLDQDPATEYVVLIGVDGVSTGSVRITLEGTEYQEPIINGAAVFRSNTWPFDLEGKVPIVVTNNSGSTHTYYRTILEAGTLHEYFQHQFIIVDRDFNGREDPIEDADPPCSSNPDYDGDGFEDSACEGEDCDDTDPDVYPGAEEICDNLLDDDCDEYVDCMDTDCTGSPSCEIVHQASSLPSGRYSGADRARSQVLNYVAFYLLIPWAGVFFLRAAFRRKGQGIM